MASRDRSRKLPVSQAPRPRWSPALIEGVVAGEAAVLGAVLARETPEATVEAAATALVRAEELAGAAIARDPGATPIACRAGCSSCCAAKVVVTAPEILRIAAHLRETRDEASLDALRERVRAIDAQTRGKTRQERAALGLRCPLLDESGSCSVHAVRPLHCLGWTSFDAAACERHWAAPGESLAPPHHDDVYELASAVLAGLGRACFEVGLDGSLLELIAALRIALERPSAGERWQKRLPVFSTAIDAEWRAPRERA
ncbi:MAG: YkgJ family cysteine cluster protein [Byssovorax sp.]